MIYVLLADGMEEIEALTPVDLLRRAGLEVKTVALGNTKRVCGSHGIVVEADLFPAEIKEKTDLLILPGGMPGSLNLDASPVTDLLLSMADRDDGRVAAICAAPLVLGRRGRLQGLHATCYPGFEKELVGAITEGARVVTDGRYTTAMGMGAAEEFAGELISLLAGRERAETILASIHARG